MTERERQLLQLIADGGYEKTAAAALNLTTDTVKTTLRRVRRRLGARNTTHAVALAWRQGYIQ